MMMTRAHCNPLHAIILPPVPSAMLFLVYDGITTMTMSLECARRRSVRRNDRGGASVAVIVNDT